MTTIFLLAIILLGNLAVETQETNAWRQPLGFLNQDFWNSSPDDGNIKTALFGDGTPNSSAYNRFWTGWCNITEVIQVNPQTMPTTIQPNKIYILNSGSYNISNTIIMGNCSAIVGKWKVKIIVWNFHGIWISSKNVIIDNIKIQWDSLNNWILLNSASRNTINNVETRNSKIWISIENSNNNTLNKITSHDNINYGIQLLWSSNNYINNSQVYNHTNSGNVGILLEGSKYNIMNNNHIFNNDAGIKLNTSDANTINNSQIYNNKMWVFVDWNYARENIVNNCNIYNNEYGYKTWVTTISNNLIATWALIQSRGYFQLWWGITFKYNSNIETMFENFENNIFKNKKNTVNAYFNDSNTGLLASNILPNNYINKSNFYNNNTGIYLHSIQGNNSPLIWNRSAIALLTYFWENKLFGNTKNIEKVVSIDITGAIFTWTNNLLWRNPGTLLIDGENMSQYWITNPVNSTWGKLIENFTNRNAKRWIQSFLTVNTNPIKYVIGKNISKQIELVKRTTNWSAVYPINFGVEIGDYNTNNYIASVVAELNAVDENIVNYYYWPDSEFTVNRSGNNCSLWAMTVEYVNNSNLSNQLLDSGRPLGHTIYVLTDGQYNLGSTIEINDNCIAIVNQWSGATFKRSWTSDSPLIQVNGKENIIINNLNLDGKNSSNLNVSNYGILFEKIINESSNNNTVNNVKSFNHKKNGIMLWQSASYNTIMNTQTWNNTENGIEIYLWWNYNIINNSLSYNNNRYGIRFGNISKFNTINNSQFFNNGIGGIFADFTTEQNIINNVHTYNNAIYGLNFKRSSGNNLNEVYSYNNKIWINITDTSCVNNKFNNDLFVFGNSQANLTGTNWEDNFLSSNWPNGNLSRYGGILQTGDDSMNCSWATNPRYTYLNNTSWLLDENYSCANTWKQNSWNPTYSNNIDYMFWLWVSKQIEPIWYVDGEISNLNNQYNQNAYIWEVNPIIWTNPGEITIMSGSDTNLQLNTEHEMAVVYNTWTINHNFNVVLTLYPSNTNWHVEIKTGGLWHNIWTWMSWVNFLEMEWIKIVVTTPNAYYQNVSGTIYIGTNQYGHNTKNFNIRTIADQTPPSISWSGNIYPGGIWNGQSNIWQAIINGAYATTSWASYVTWADDCNTWMVSPLLIYNWAPQNIILNQNYNTLNDKYVCIVAKDNVNNQYTTWLSNQIKISKVEFVDNIAVWPVYYDIIDINFQNVQNYWYRRVNTGSECGNGLSGLSFINYNGPIVINSTILNGKYLCAYAQDISGSGKYLLSSNKLNIVDYSNTVNFIDNVSENWVSNDIVSVYFSSAIQFSHKEYKRVEEISDCSNTWWMVNYTWAIMIDHEWLNWKHFCLYSREQISGVENYLISNNRLKVDSTNPTDAAIISPTSWQNIYWIIIKTLWASDGESGLAWFEYEIAENATFLDVIANGVALTIWNEFSPIFNESESNYAIRIRAVDNVWNKSDRSNTVDINYKNLANFTFQDVNNAQILTSHTSNEITMWWLGINETIKASITNGTLYRNWNALWTSGLVQNNDKLSIKMISSENYSGVVQTKLKIANRIIPWKITTAQTGIINTGTNNTWSVTGFNLTPTEMLSVEAIFNSIIAMYSNPTQLHSFLLVMRSMLQDNIALAWNGNAENLRYLLYLIDQYIATHFNNQNSNVHKAPNCKEYNIVYNTWDNTYFSPNTVKQTKFGSRDELIKFLDSHNPWDCHINVYGNTISYNNTDPNRHIAPNGKVYSIQSGDIWYSSSEFVSIKYFPNISELRSYIDKNNPAIVVWDHQVDTTFEPIVHNAPNGKDYKIYKTSRGYMSYKLIKVQYFGWLEELKAYINKNNK